jgi:CheY-like chemotaxis protein
MSELFHRTLGETVEIETAVAAGLWQTHADSNQLEAALLNLAVNARDAMPDGGKLTIATANVELDRSHAAANGDVTPGPYVMISVADTGVGMTDEVLAQAFEPFFTTKDVGQGTGLGLSQVYGFVKQSGGHVQIDSEPSVGTTVKIYLPRRHFAKDSSERAEESVRAPVAAPTETILVVEDEDGVRSYGTEILRELGYAVLEAIDGPSALEVLDREPDVDLLFTDIGLPGGIDGRQLADEARARRPGLRVLLTTAYAGKALIEDGRLAPGLQLLPKPFTYGALATKVRELLDLAGDAPRVLVVGNVAGTTVRETLVTAGCRVDEAATPGDALAKFHAAGKRLRAAVVDMGLFDGQGDGLIAELRAARPALPIVLAMDGDAGAPESAVDDERLTVLAKPIDGRRLRTALQMLGVKMPTQRRPTRPGTEPRRTD